LRVQSVPEFTKYIYGTGDLVMAQGKIIKSSQRLAGLAIVLLLTVGTSSAIAAGNGSTSARSSSAWAKIVSKAKGQTVSLWMWGGDVKANSYVDKSLIPAAAKYGVKLRRVPIADTKDALNRVLAEHQAKSHNGSVDLIWVNGDNFKTGLQAGIWSCNWANHLPNSKFVNPIDPLLISDFGTPVNGCEAPWHKAQFSFVYNAANVASPPKTLLEFFSWAKSHPGRFTYPQASDFTGAAFLRQSLNAVSGGYKNVPLAYSIADYDRLTISLWEALSELNPYLWRSGQTFPRTSVELDKLFSDGQVDFTMTYGPATLTQLVTSGTFPKETKILPLSEGTLGNASFLGMPNTSGNQAGAQVVANIALSPEQQLIKANPKIWGQFTVLDMNRLPANYKALFAKLPKSSVVPSFKVLSLNANPELSADWVNPLTDGWRKNILHAP